MVLANMIPKRTPGRYNCHMDLGLNGKRAIVTGGSKGIGKAVARALAEEGCDVVVAARTIDTLEDAAEELAAATHRRVVPIVVDTGSLVSVEAMVGAAANTLGGIDILVNSAAQPMGQSRPPKLADITDDVFWGDVNVKVMGYLRCAQAVAPGMAAQGWGRIINISGLGARSTGSAVGSMRNVAVAALTKNLADELGPSGVNVTVVHPGPTVTEREPPSSLVAGVSIGRFVTAAEIADVIAFLCSPRSVAINGDAIAVGGGARGVIHY
jgi:NAD(P)-dependent dehydrogenase (short-subunit alcohol dehydrogenase family)